MTPASATTLPQLVQQSARAFGPRTALASREGLRTRSLTYAGLETAMTAIAAEALGPQGLARGQRVILLAPAGVRTVAIIFGLMRAGVIVVPLDQNSTPAFIAAVARKTDSAAIVAAPGLPLPEGLRRIGVEAFPLTSPALPPLAEPAPQDIAEIVFTSGTTGDPKGVVLTHANILADVTGASAIVPRGEAMELLSILPLSHMFEQTAGLYLPLLHGGTVHYAPTLKPSVVIAEMLRWRVTGMVVVPRFLTLLMTAVEDRVRARGQTGLWALQHRLAARLPLKARRFLFPQLHRALGGKLRYFLSGGAALAPEVMMAWERTGIRIIEGYGATECAPVITSNDFDDRVPGSIGHPLAGVETRLSEEGEIQVRGANVFSGYWDDPDRSRAAFTEDGWYRTEDVAEAQGRRLRIIGRISERIVLPSGMKVYPADVETRLSQEDGVRDCVVLGLADERGGEQLHAVIRPAEGTDPALLGAAVDRANAALASHQRIAGFTIWAEDFPKTALQKVKRKELKAALSAARSGAAPAPQADPVGLAGRLLRAVLRTTPGEIGPAARLEADLGLDSLGRVELAAQIERITGKDVSEEAVSKLATAGDLAALLANPGPPVSPAPYPAWPWSGAAVTLRRLVQPPALFLPHRIFARSYTVEGADALKRMQGPVLFVANHASHADTLAILRALPPDRRARTAVAAAEDYFFANPLAAKLAPAVLGAFPFSREGRVRDSLDQCGRLMDEGRSILIYPEGTRSPDGRLLPFKSGIGLLATGLGAPIVPIAVTGGVALLPKGTSWPRRADVAVRFGAPTTLPPGTTPEAATGLLQAAVAALLARTGPLKGEGHG